MSNSIPSHILILGSGVFGLSTAYALSKRAAFSETRISVVSPNIGLTDCETSPTQPTPASFDTNRIIRADYADPLYASLAREAQALWRTEEWGGQGRYHECGLLLTGEAYVQKAMTNVCCYENIKVLSSQEEVAEAMRAGPSIARGTGDHGYINFQSGWADASSAMRDMENRIRISGRVNLIHGRAETLTTDGSGKKIIGARLTDGRLVEADLTILAMGAWTASLVDLSGAASCTAQIVAYYDLTDEEARKLAMIPVHLSIHTGCFVFPPNKKLDGSWEIKAARHFYGYSNPTKCASPLGPKLSGYAPSLPCNDTTIPASDQLFLSDFLGEALPVLGKGRRARCTRLCHYSDTRSGDFIVSPYPSYTGMFVTTGDSGHAFKMLPVLGEKVVDVLVGTDPDGRWTKAWAYPSSTQTSHVWCNDGSRGGSKGMTLAQVREASDAEIDASKRP